MLDELCRANQEKYVTDVLAGRIANDFATVSQAANASLPYTAFALITAAR